MEEKNNILSEIKSVAPLLAGIDRFMPYQVPEAYFELLPLKMLARVSEPAKKPAVPEGYFDELPGIMLSKVKSLSAQHELDEIAPALVGINRQMPYSVPAGYFETFGVNPVEEATPVIQLRPKRNIMKWAVAASVIAIAGFFAWQYLLSPANTVTTQQVATTEADSTDTLQLGVALAELADTSIHMALDETGSMPADTWSALYYLNTENFESALKDFSDEELKNQLTDQLPIKNKS